MIPTISRVLGWLALITYLSAAVAMYRALQSAFPQRLSEKARLGSLWFGWLATILHAAALFSYYSSIASPDFSFLNALSAVALIIVSIILLSALFKPIEKLGLVVFPLAAIILLLKLLVPEDTHILHNRSWPMVVHVLSSITAYAFLNIAAIQAILLAIQDWCLRKRQPGGLLVRSLPPIQTMEALLFQLIGTGFILLTLSLVTGFIYLEDMFAQHLVHKTVLSIFAWFVFAALLAGRVKYGWRGKTAMRWTIGGFMSLMLAYFGSKMVLEWILDRN